MISTRRRRRGGDPVKPRAIEQLGIAVAGSVRARKGTVLTFLPVTVVEFRVVVVEMNPCQRQVAVQTSHGQRRVFNIRPKMDLGGLKVGDDVAVQATEVIAIELGNPTKKFKFRLENTLKIRSNANISPKQSNNRQRNLNLDAGTPMKNIPLLRSWNPTIR
jgi:hypothetical protein